MGLWATLVLVVFCKLAWGLYLCPRVAWTRFFLWLGSEWLWSVGCLFTFFGVGILGAFGLLMAWLCRARTWADSSSVDGLTRWLVLGWTFLGRQESFLPWDFCFMSLKYFDTCPLIFYIGNTKLICDWYPPIKILMLEFCIDL